MPIAIDRICPEYYVNLFQSDALDNNGFGVKSKGFWF